MCLLLLGACAGAQVAPESERRAEDCEGANCGPLLAQSDDLEAREAKAEVKQAEAARREAAFRSRLLALREAEEARFRARTQESPNPAAEDEDEQSVTEMAAELAALGPQARAPRPRSPPRPPETEAETRAAPPQSPAFGPTPRELLETSLCLLAEDEAHAELELRTRGRPRQERSAWALTLVELQALQEDILQERRHRGLADEDPSCTSKVKELLRTLYGPGAQRQGADGTLRSVDRLRRELQVRAGLPRLDGEDNERPRPPARVP